jgi:putative phosphoesterase
VYTKINKDNVRVGVLSDTHGQIRRELYSLFSGVEYLLHAGDIGSPETLRDLEKIAPVCAVLGNTDNFLKFPNLSETAFFETARSRLYITHNCSQLDMDPNATDVNGIICGHTHVPSVEHHKNVLFLNPGSAGPRRFDLPVSIAILEIQGTEINVKLIEIPTS